MIIDKEGHTTIVFQESTSMKNFMERFLEHYPKIRNDNIILSLLSATLPDQLAMKQFLELSGRQRANKKSFVLVSDRLTYDEVPEAICLAPSLQEARDIVDMEDIERDLGL